MTDKLKALVIGGSGSLGSEVCQVLAQKGFDLAFTYHLGHGKAEALSADLREQGYAVQAFHLDLANIGQVRKVIRKANEKLGRLDSLVVTSGLATDQRADDQHELPKYFEITPDGFDKMVEINVRGVFFACQEAAMIMSAQGSGRIVITGSVDGVKIFHPPADYACCKTALWGITQALAKELGEYNILVNMIAPGVMEGGIANHLSKELMNEYLKHCSLRRVGKFVEIANVVAFLAGHKNTYVTGQAVILDGAL